MPCPPRHPLRRVLPVLLALLAAPAFAEPSQPEGAVLTPDVGPRIEAAFARAEPTFHLQNAAIKPRSVNARVCRRDATCLDLVLTPPDAPCPGQKLTTWCVQFPAGVPRDADLLFRALDGAPVWSTPHHAQRADHAPATPSLLALLARFMTPLLALAVLFQLVRERLPAAWRRERAWLIMLLMACGNGAWLGSQLLQTLQQDGAAIWGLSTTTWLAIWWLMPIALGGLLGLVLRWGCLRRARAAWSAWLPLVVGPIFGAWLAVQTGRIGAMDGAALALVTVLTWLAVAHARFAKPLPWLVSLGTLLLGLGTLEVATRMGQPPPVIEATTLSLLNNTSPRPDGLPVAAGDLLVNCALHAEIGEETARCLRLGPLPKDKPWLLHLGDSMLFGSGAPPESALPAQLAALLPQVGHVNAGVPGTSVDTELALLLRVLQVAKPAAVVLYAMPGNDADEVDAPTESCNGQAPLDLRGATPVLRCPQAMWATRSWRMQLLHSRLPLPIAALTGVSWLARHLEWLHRLAVEPPRAHEHQPPGDARNYQRYLHALVAGLRQAGVPLQVVVMPLRRSQYAEYVEPRRAQLLAVFRDEGLAVIDTQPAVDQWTQAEGEAQLFIDEPHGDIHLNPYGLASLAAFLAPQLQLPQAVYPMQ